MFNNVSLDLSKPSKIISLIAILAVFSTTSSTAHEQNHVHAKPHIDSAITGVGNILGRLIGSTIVNGIRSFAEFTYESAQYQSDSNSFLLLGARIVIPNGSNQCEITAHSITASASPSALALLSDAPLTISARGLNIPTSCFGAQGLQMAAILRMPTLAISNFTTNIEYDLPSGSANADVYFTIDQLADGEILAEISYISFGSSYAGISAGNSVQPDIKIGRVNVSLQDKGLQQVLQTLSGMFGMNEQSLSKIMTSALREISNNDEFVTIVRSNLMDFWRSGGQLSLSMRPPKPLNLSALTNLPPAKITEAMAVKVSRNPVTNSPSVAIVDALKNKTTTDQQKRTLARAALKGIGLPLNPTKALALIKEIKSPSTQDGILLTQAMMANDEDMTKTYLFAQSLPTSVTTGALLDRLEGKMSAEELVAVQSIAPQALSFDSSLTFAQMARSHLSGGTNFRNYRAAYLQALFAKASGELGADFLLTRVESKLAASADWIEVRNRWRDEASSIWIAEKLHSRN